MYNTITQQYSYLSKLLPAASRAPLGGGMVELFQGGKNDSHHTGMCTLRYILSTHLSSYPTQTPERDSEYERNLELLNASSSVMTYERYLA